MKADPWHVTEDQLIDLVNGLLTESDAREVLGHIKTCAECDANFARLAGHHERLRGRSAPSVSADGRLVPPAAGKSGVVRRRVAQTGVVAAVLAAVVVGMIAMPRAPESPGTTPQLYWMPTTADEQTIRTREDIDDALVLAQGIEAYRNRDIDAAVAALTSVSFSRGQQELELMRILYLSSALVNIGRHEDAINTLTGPHIPRYPWPWRQRARWVRYLGVRGAGNDEEAAALLELLVDDDGEIGELARAERRRLER